MVAQEGGALAPKPKEMEIIGHGRLGMMFEKGEGADESRLEVVNIAKGGVAHLQGVQIRDVITGVNGVLLQHCLMDPSSTAELAALMKVANRPVSLTFNQPLETPTEPIKTDIRLFKELLVRGLQVANFAPKGGKSRSFVGQTVPMYMCKDCLGLIASISGSSNTPTVYAFKDIQACSSLNEEPRSFLVHHAAGDIKIAMESAADSKVCAQGLNSIIRATRPL